VVNGQTARNFIDALKDQPLVLALVTMNIGLLVLQYFAFQERHLEMELLYRNRTEVGQLLKDCVPVQK
jgi:hypothetical protein